MAVGLTGDLVASEHRHEPEHATTLFLETVEPTSLVQILRPENMVLMIVLAC